MIRLKGSIELEPTAALVMDWARDLYRTGCASEFYSCLDLSAGLIMRRDCDAVCPWYPEVMMNRKWFIRHLASAMISAAQGLCQVIIPAAGRSPLALELLDTHPDKISAVIETDLAWMEEKQQLYARTAPGPAQKIRCVHADLYDPKRTWEAIAATGVYDPSRTTVVVLEGISYYIPPSLLSSVISIFATESRQNRVILDHLFPCTLVREDRQYISRGIWKVIHRDCQFSKTVTYSPGAMEETLSCGGCRRMQHYSMHVMEALRTGGNQYFPDESSGWIAVSTGRM